MSPNSPPPFPFSLSVLFLCYNDAATIERCVRSAFAELQSLVNQFEVIVVNDGSHDRSRAILDQLAGEFKDLRILHHPTNLGYGTTLQDGMLLARGDFLLCSDGDGQFDPSEGHKLLQIADPSIAIVGGVRHPRSDPWYRRLTGTLCNITARRLFTLDLVDFDCGFKLFRTSCIPALFPLHSRMAVWIEICWRAHLLGYRCRNVQVRHCARAHGRSAAFTPRNIATLISETGALWSDTLTSRFRLPAKQSVPQSLGQKTRL